MHCDEYILLTMNIANIKLIVSCDYTKCFAQIQPTAEPTPRPSEEVYLHLCILNKGAYTQVSTITNI